MNTVCVVLAARATRSTGTGNPIRQLRPGGQATQAVEPTATDCTLMVGQKRHDEAPFAAENKPGGHDTHVWVPFCEALRGAEYDPAAHS